jgi:transcriptional regulator with XRE-family HTH domain
MLITTSSIRHLPNKKTLNAKGGWQPLAGSEYGSLRIKGSGLTALISGRQSRNFVISKLLPIYFVITKLSSEFFKNSNFFSEIFNMDDVWNRIDRLMLEYKFFYRKIAEALEINESTVSTWRKNRTIPRADDLVKIAKLLETSAEYLVTGQEPDTNLFYRDALKSIQDIVNRTLL